MNVVEIVTEYLIKNGYDGLYTYNCGCCLGDLMPCDSPVDHCLPGYLQHHTVEQVQNQGEYDYIECEGGDDCQCIGEKSPTPSEKGKE